MSDEPGSVDCLPGGLFVKDLFFNVPVVHGRDKSVSSQYPFEEEQIVVFARECVHAPLAGKQDLPWVLFLQGGPGFPSPRPRDNSGWIKRLTQEYRLLLLDQRGTGRSALINHQSLARFKTDEEKAAYLTHFRQDSIVRDCEIIREELLGKNSKWALYGQSYGGFCIMSYISMAPESISMTLFTGGIPPILRSPEEVYAETFQICLHKNISFYERYPGDVKRINDVVRYIRQNKVYLPNGDLLTIQRLRSLGLNFYGSGGFEAIHWLFEDTWVEGADGSEVLNHKFLCAIQAFSPFETNPLYALLHEQIYVANRASNWAAHRVMKKHFPEYKNDGGDNDGSAEADVENVSMEAIDRDARYKCSLRDKDLEEPFFFTGEMVFPWMFEDYGLLKPLKGVAKILAEKKDWPKLYDINVIRTAHIPSAAVIYYEDMCVVRKFSEETVSLMPNIQCWVTNEYEHNGSSVDGERIISNLLARLPSPSAQ